MGFFFLQFDSNDEQTRKNTKKTLKIFEKIRSINDIKINNFKLNLINTLSYDSMRQRRSLFFHNLSIGHYNRSLTMKTTINTGEIQKK